MLSGWYLWSLVENKSFRVKVLVSRFFTLLPQVWRGRLLLCCRSAERADQGEGASGKIQYLHYFPNLQEIISQVAPAELENLVRSLDGVADCAVLGVPHPRAGQVILCSCALWKHHMFLGFHILGLGRWVAWYSVLILCEKIALIHP